MACFTNRYPTSYGLLVTSNEYNECGLKHNMACFTNRYPTSYGLLVTSNEYNECGLKHNQNITLS